MYHEEGSLIFKLEHLDRYAIVKETLYVDCKKTTPSLQWMIFTQKTTAVDPKSKGYL
jgi:hypothetical protein